ncbi:MAG TPA: MATE family efflux transporter, partial [Clostridiales bacterium]|nr:MATE family efflux transporter [Clostridiales bacterium]
MFIENDIKDSVDNKVNTANNEICDKTNKTNTLNRESNLIINHSNKLRYYLKKYIFSDRPFYEKLWMLALPIIIQNFMSSFLNIIDTIMIGQIGEIQIAAVGVANQYFLLCLLVIIGIHSGCSILMSQYWGKGDKKNIMKVQGVGLIVSFFAATVFATLAFVFSKEIISIFNKEELVIAEGAKYLKIVCFSYIFTAISLGYAFASRSIGDALMPMIVTGIAIICNTTFNYVLIFGKLGAPALGVEGAAIATNIARIVESIIIVSYIYGKNSILAVKFIDLHGIQREYLIKMFKTVLPVVLNEGFWALGSVVRSIAYGRIGSHAMAAVQICNTVQNLFNVAVFGMAAASAVMIGHK